MYTSGAPPLSAIGGASSARGGGGTSGGNHFAPSASMDYANALQFSHTSALGHSGASNPSTNSYHRHGSGVEGLSPSAFMSPSLLNGNASTTTLSRFDPMSPRTAPALADFGRRGDSSRHSSRRRTSSRGGRHSVSDGRPPHRSPLRPAHPPPPLLSRTAIVTFASPTPESLALTQALISRGGPSSRSGSSSTTTRSNVTSGGRSLLTVDSTNDGESPPRSPVPSDRSKWDDRRRRGGSGAGPPDAIGRGGAPHAEAMKVEAKAPPPGAAECCLDWRVLPPRDDAPDTICAHCRRTRKPPAMSSPRPLFSPAGDALAQHYGAGGAEEEEEVVVVAVAAARAAKEGADTAASLRYCEDLFACPCGTAWYCGPACQRSHWPLHKSRCGHGVRGGGAAHGVVRTCQWCGRQSRDLLSCPCGDAFYCGPPCQLEDWRRNHVFFCRLVSRQAVLQRVLGLDTYQRQRRQTRDAATQTMPASLSAPGIELVSAPFAVLSKGERSLSAQQSSQLHRSLQPFGYHPAVGHTNSGELQLSSGNEISGAESSGRAEHLMEDGRSGSGYRPDGAPASLTGAAAGVSSGRKHSASMYAYGESWRDPTGFSNDASPTSTAAPGASLRGLSKYSTCAHPTVQDTYRNPTGQGGGASQVLQQSRSHHRDTGNSFHDGGWRSTAGTSSRRSFRFNQSTASLKESGYASPGQPSSHGGKRWHDPHHSLSGMGGYDESEERQGREDGDAGSHAQHSTPARSSRRHGNESASLRGGAGFLTQQQLPGLTAFFFATRKVLLEEEAHSRTELWRQLTLKRVDIALSALTKAEADARVAIVTEEVMACIKVLRPATKKWKESLFNYYYR